MLGLIFLPVLVLIFDLNRRSRFHIRGSKRKTRHGVRYWVRSSSRNDGAGTRSVISVRAPLSFDFVIREESKADQVAKRIGLSREMQTGDRAFDRSVFVESDDPLLEQLLSQKALVRESLLKMFSGRSGVLKIVRIGCRDGTLNARADKKTSELPGAVTDKIADRLSAIATELWKLPHATGGPRDVYARRARWIKWAFGTLAVVGAVGFWRSLALPYAVIDSWDLFWASLVVSLTIFGCCTALMVVLLGRGARSHVILVECLALGLYACVTLGYTIGYQGNVLLDTSVAIPHVFTSGQYSGNESRGKTTIKRIYIVPDWREGHVQESRVIKTLRYSLGNPMGSYRLHNDGRLEILVRQGAFGFDWVESIRQTGP